LQRSFAIPAFRRENLEYLAFVIHRPPQVMRFVVDPDEHFIQVPTPSGKRPIMNVSLLDLCREHRSEPNPLEPNRLVANIYAALEQNILHLPKRQRMANVHHDNEADHLGRTVVITERN
jgi:hypothetical protein